MSENNNHKSKNEDGIAWWIAHPFKLMLYVVICLLLSFCINLAWVKLFSHGSASLQIVVDETRGLLWQKAVYEYIYKALYWISFDITGFQDALMHGRNAYAIQSRITSWIIANHFEELKILFLTIDLFSARLALLASFVPLLFLLLFVAFSDGLIERYIRTKCGGNESSKIFHRTLKWGLLGTPAIIFVVNLLPPIYLHPAWSVLPVLLLNAWLIRTATKYYKKYL